MSRVALSYLQKFVCVLTLMCFFASTFIYPAAAQGIVGLPQPGTMLNLTPAYNPAIVAGITFNPQNPLQFDFLIDSGDDHLKGDALKAESKKLVNYFLATLTTPEDQMWVNLSPYEEDRIIADGLSQTEMGRDMLAQDYILKQLTSSLMYPEDELGKKFWNRIKDKALEQFGTNDIPTDVFNKVWIVPQKAVIYTKDTSVFVADSYLKVMLDSDYMALNDHPTLVVDQNPQMIEIIREILIPEIEKEVNTGKNFALLRQMYHSMILATWYKNNLKSSFLSKLVADQNKTAGITIADKQIKEKIYNQYLEAFKQGAYNLIKEEYDPATQQVIPKKYFSGGLDLAQLANASVNTNLPAQNSWLRSRMGDASMVGVAIDLKINHDQAMTAVDGMMLRKKQQEGQRLIRDSKLDGKNRLNILQRKYALGPFVLGLWDNRGKTNFSIIEGKKALIWAEKIANELDLQAYHKENGGYITEIVLGVKRDADAAMLSEEDHLLLFGKASFKKMSDGLRISIDNGKLLLWGVEAPFSIYSEDNFYWMRAVYFFAEAILSQDEVKDETLLFVLANHFGVKDTSNKYNLNNANEYTRRAWNLMRDYKLFKVLDDLLKASHNQEQASTPYRLVISTHVDEILKVAPIIEKYQEKLNDLYAVMAESDDGDDFGVVKLELEEFILSQEMSQDLKLLVARFITSFLVDIEYEPSSEADLMMRNYLIPDFVSFDMQNETFQIKFKKDGQEVVQPWMPKLVMDLAEDVINRIKKDQAMVTVSEVVDYILAQEWMYTEEVDTNKFVKAFNIYEAGGSLIVNDIKIEMGVNLNEFLVQFESALLSVIGGGIELTKQTWDDLSSLKSIINVAFEMSAAAFFEESKKRIPNGLESFFIELSKKIERRPATYEWELAQILRDRDMSDLKNQKYRLVKKLMSSLLPGRAPEASVNINDLILDDTAEIFKAADKLFGDNSNAKQAMNREIGRFLLSHERGSIKYAGIRVTALMRAIVENTKEGRTVVDNINLFHRRDWPRIDSEEPLDQFVQRILSDQAMVTDEKDVGGIDFNANFLELEGQMDMIQFTVPFEFQGINPAFVDGLTPVIINVMPIINFPMMLGLLDLTEQLAFKDD